MRVLHYIMLDAEGTGFEGGTQSQLAGIPLSTGLCPSNKHNLIPATSYK